MAARSGIIGGVRRAAIAVVVFACLLGSAPAVSAPVAYGMQALLNADGSGEMFANSSDVNWSWQACPGPGATGCTAFASGNPANTGDAPAGSMFIATASNGGTVTSPVWHGNVVSTSAPSVSGPVRANELITPIAGGWSGGWAGDFDREQLAACANEDGSDCISLTDLNYVAPCPAGAAVIDPVFTGWYLRVADQRYGPGTSFITIGYSSPYGHPVWRAGPTIAVAMAGRIAPATSPRTEQCGAPPLPPGAHLRAPNWCASGGAFPTCVEATISRQGVAEIWCSIACRVTIRATRGRQSVSIVQTLRTFARVPLRRRLITRLGPGRILISINLNGKRLAARHVTIRGHVA